MILNKLRGSFANMPWFTGKVGIDLGRNGSRPLDLDPRAGAKGGDNRGAEVRRTAALGRGLTGVGVLDAPGSIWLGTWTGSTSTPRRTRLGHPHGVLERGQSSRRRAAERQRRRAKPREKSESARKSGLASFTTSTRSYWAANSSTGSSGTALRRRAPRAPQGNAVRVSCGARTAAAAWCGPRAQARATYRDGGAPWSAGPSADVGAGQDSAGSPIRARGRGWS